MSPMEIRTPWRAEFRLLAASLFCGIVHYYLFYKKGWSLSYPLFVLLFYSLVYRASAGRHALRLQASAALLVPIALLSLTYAVFTNFLFLVLNALVIPALVVVHTTWLLRSNAFAKQPVRRLLEHAVVQPLRYALRPAAMLYEAVMNRLHGSRFKQALNVLLGLALSVPLLAVVLVLLASADNIFERALSAMPNWFNTLPTEEAIVGAFWITLVTTGLFAYMAGLLWPRTLRQPAAGTWPTAALPQTQADDLPAGSASVDAIQPGAQVRPVDSTEDSASGYSAVEGLPAAGKSGAAASDDPPRRGGLDATVAVTMLTVLNLVYVLFAAVQFSYLFGVGGGMPLPDGMTYAAYARHGFAELVTVTLINLSVLLAVLYGVRRPSRAGWLAVRVLLALLVGCTAVLLSSAYLRLFLYEQAYGYTIARLLVQAFMALLLVLFALALVKLRFERLPLVRSGLVAVLLAYLTINYMDIDGMIVRGNMARYEATGALDADYLGDLSYEAVGSLLAFRQKHPEAPGIEQALDRYRNRLASEASSRSWSEWNWSKAGAEQALSR